MANAILALLLLSPAVALHGNLRSADTLERALQNDDVQLTEEMLKMTLRSQSQISESEVSDADIKALHKMLDADSSGGVGGKEIVNLLGPMSKSGGWQAALTKQTITDVVRALPALAVDQTKSDVELTGDCACMNWREAYDQNEGLCGQGLEVLYREIAEKDGTMSHEEAVETDEDACKGNAIFKRQKHSMCMKEGGGMPLFYKNWCYVSSSCQDINGGKQVNQKISYKYCDRKKGDKLISDLRPADVLNLAREQDQSPAFLVSVVYPVAPDLFETTPFSKELKACPTCDKPPHGAYNTHEAGNVIVLESMATRVRARVGLPLMSQHARIYRDFLAGQPTVFLSPKIYFNAVVMTDKERWMVRHLNWPPQDFKIFGVDLATKGVIANTTQHCTIGDCRDISIKDWDYGH